MNDDNPLDRLKSLREETDTPPAGKQPYLAFKAVNRRQLRLWVKSAHNGGQFRLGERLAYSYLHRIVDDDLLNQQLALVYQFGVVIVRGRNLYAVAEAIEREVCEWIQPYIPDRWENPADQAAPFIETIDIRVDREQMAKLLDEFMEGATRPRR
jgi:hypothetical protein